MRMRSRSSPPSARRGSPPITCTPSSRSTDDAAPSRAGESWFPAIATMSIAGRARRTAASSSNHIRSALAGGVALSNTSPVITSASAASRTHASNSQPRNAACSYSRVTSPRSVCPRCQSEVWTTRIAGASSQTRLTTDQEGRSRNGNVPLKKVPDVDDQNEDHHDRERHDPGHVDSGLDLGIGASSSHQLVAEEHQTAAVERGDRQEVEQAEVHA